MVQISSGTSHKLILRLRIGDGAFPRSVKMRQNAPFDGAIHRAVNATTEPVGDGVESRVKSVTNEPTIDGVENQKEEPAAVPLVSSLVVSETIGTRETRGTRAMELSRSDCLGRRHARSLSIPNRFPKAAFAAGL